MPAIVKNKPCRYLGLAILVLIISLLLMVLNPGRNPDLAEAHGKEPTVGVTSLIPNPEQPLLRLYRAHIVYAADNDQVDGATVMLSAQRKEGGPEITSVQLTGIKEQPGVYVGEVEFPRFGSWEVSIRIFAALGQGQGLTQFVDQIRPAIIGPGEEAALLADAERVRKSQVFFQFAWWPDVVNIMVRIVHSVSGMTYFVITGLILFMAWAGVPSAWPNLPRNIGRFFLPAVLASLVGLGATGLYSAAFDAPIKSPGIYDIGGMLELPYGEAYLGAFLVKPLAWFAMVFLVFAMHRHLKNYRGAPMLGGGVIAVYPARPTLALSLKRLATINAGIGLILVADVALVIYLHYLSHLGVFLPSN